MLIISDEICTHINTHRTILTVGFVGHAKCVYYFIFWSCSSWCWLLCIAVRYTYLKVIIIIIIIIIIVIIIIIIIIIIDIVNIVIVIIMSSSSSSLLSELSSSQHVSLFVEWRVYVVNYKNTILFNWSTINLHLHHHSSFNSSYVLYIQLRLTTQYNQNRYLINITSYINRYITIS